jgi:putative transposase
MWLVCEYGRYGYRRITGLLHWQGWRVNHKPMERIWLEEGLKVPIKRSKRKRLWFNNGSRICLRPTHRNPVLGYDFVADRTSDSHPIRMPTIVDEYTRECLTTVSLQEHSNSIGKFQSSPPTPGPKRRQRFFLSSPIFCS